MIWRLLLVAEKRFRKIDAPHLATQVYRGVVFEDGVKITKSNQRAAADLLPNAGANQDASLCGLSDAA